MVLVTVLIFKASPLVAPAGVSLLLLLLLLMLVSEPATIDRTNKRLIGIIRNIMQVRNLNKINVSRTARYGIL